MIRFALPFVVLILTWGAAPALAHTPDSGTTGEAEMIGGQHAGEHAYRRAVERQFGALSPARQRRLASDAASSARTYARRTGELAPETFGSWTQEPFALPNYAIHSVVMPTGKVLFWGYPPKSRWANVGEASIWDPSLGHGPSAFESVEPPIIDPDGPGPQEAGPAPIYCSGQSLLQNGVVLVAGGNFTWPTDDPDDEYEHFSGTDTVFTFDPWTESWRQQPSMTEGHWYPSQVLLGDGRTLILGGLTDEAPGDILSDDLEIFTQPATGVGTGTVERSETTSRETGLYPHLFGLPDGDVLLAGPNYLDSALIKPHPEDPADFTTKDLGIASRDRIGGTAVLRPQGPRGSWRVTQLGGYSYATPPEGNLVPATATTETIDARVGYRKWKADSSLRVRRSYHNTVLLPDSSMVTIGGGAGRSIEMANNHGLDPGREQRRVEIFNPQTRRWELGPAQVEDRTYHSTAMLLPDGRVWSAGDDLYPLKPDGSKSEEDTAEIYSPPYLFRGPRPEITEAPQSLGFRRPFVVKTGKGGPAPASAVLVAPSATTHAADMHQRVVPLRVKGSQTSKLELKAPPNANVAPPGYYMLFTLTADGVPSVARWVLLGDSLP